MTEQKLKRDERLASHVYKKPKQRWNQDTEALVEKDLSWQRSVFKTPRWGQEVYRNYSLLNFEPKSTF